jgi:pantetheine-phosphate adenylyltransferase
VHLVVVAGAAVVVAVEQDSMKQYTAIGMGGTFDHFHVGHQHFLEFAAELAETVVVGITIPELSSHKVAAALIEPFEVRQKAVESFLTARNIPHEVFALHDTFGPTLEASHVQAVAVTEQTVSGGEFINTKRAELHLPALPIHVCSLLNDDEGKLISSTRIRRGEINRKGESYLAAIRNGVTLTSQQLSAFKDPQGPVVLSVNPAHLSMSTLVVGDIVTETFLQQAWPASLFVFDERNLRQEYVSKQIGDSTHASSIASVQNAAGEISAELGQWVITFCESLPLTQTTPTFLRVNGEEDLATVALVLCAPLGTRLYYGQPHQGMVQVDVTETLKESFLAAVRTSPNQS